MFTEKDPYARIGFKDVNGGLSSFYSPSIDSNEAKFIDKWLQEIKISPLNTRLIKLSDYEYELRICSMTSNPKITPYLKTYEKDGVKLTVSAADFKDFMNKCVHHIEQSIPFASNSNQKQMLAKYVDHFKFGDIEMHKKS